jgi:hypothetical protein
MVRVALLLVFLTMVGIGGVMMASGDLPAQHQPPCDPRC